MAEYAIYTVIVARAQPKSELYILRMYSMQY